MPNNRSKDEALEVRLTIGLRKIDGRGRPCTSITLSPVVEFIHVQGLGIDLEP
jgi:hypothetical protein